MAHSPEAPSGSGSEGRAGERSSSLVPPCPSPLEGSGGDRPSWVAGCLALGGEAAAESLRFALRVGGRPAGRPRPSVRGGQDTGAWPGGPATGQDRAAPRGARGRGRPALLEESEVLPGPPRPLPPPGDGPVCHLQWSKLPSGVLAWPVARDASSLCQRP